MVFCELYIYQRQLRNFAKKSKSSYQLCKKSMHPYVIALYKTIGPFLFGAAVSQVSTDITKYSVGRLRPHFLTVCAPDYTLFNCTDAQRHMQYITQDVCTGDSHLIKEARLYII